MATQFHFAHSSEVAGAGIFASGKCIHVYFLVLHLNLPKRLQRVVFSNIKTGLSCNRICLPSGDFCFDPHLTIYNHWDINDINGINWWVVKYECLFSVPYMCGFGGIAASLTCMQTPGLVNVPFLIAEANSVANAKNIDPTSNIQGSRVYIYHGSKDSVVLPGKRVGRGLTLLEGGGASCPSMLMK